MPGGPSRYAYVTNSPLMYTDPTGESISLPKGPGIPFPLPPVFFPGSPENDRFVDACLAGLDWLGGVLNSDNQGEDKDKPYAGHTPDDKEMRKGPSGKTMKDPDNGSIWEKDYSQHGGTKWKRWPNQKAWEKGRGRESVRGDGSTRGKRQ
ncbi:MAG: hypothetical protein ABJN11_10705 [Lentilitoribacter sp.]